MAEKPIEIKVDIHSNYYRRQFDDRLAGGTIEYQSKLYYWSAQDSCYGFGWEIEPISEEGWNYISEKEFTKIESLIEKCLYEHRTEYTALTTN